MIKLHGFFPAWGLPDPSPYVMKARTLFKMAGIDFETVSADLESVPKHKAPYITKDDGSVLEDSTFIRLFLERELGANFNANYSKKELASAFAIERLCENHLNWILTHDRWVIDENFNKGPIAFFMGAPEAIRENIIREVRGRVIEGQKSHGISRHNEGEIFELAKLDIDAIVDFIGENDFILGKEPCGYDASIHATLCGIATPYFKSETGEYVRSQAKLMAYIERMNQKYYMAVD